METRRPTGLPRRLPGSSPMRYRIESGGRPAFRISPAGQRKAGPEQQRSGSPPMSGLSADTAPWGGGGVGLHRKQLRRVRKSVAGRYYQLSVHAMIDTFLHDRMPGPQRLESGECWWCNCGKRETSPQSFGPGRPDQKAMEEDWEELSVGAPESAVS